MLTLISYTWYSEELGTGKSFIFFYSHDKHNTELFLLSYVLWSGNSQNKDDKNRIDNDGVEKQASETNMFRHQTSGIWTIFKLNEWTTGGDDATKCYSSVNINRYP